MPWSTRELADLAGTTVNTVRHYHSVGLLEEPRRTSNGYKQYQVAHLVRLLQIRRLRDLGVPLDQVEKVGFSGDPSGAALQAIDADLAASIERLQRARAEIRAVLEGSTVTNVPSGFESVASRLSSPDRSLVLIYSQLYDGDAMADVRRMIESEPDDASREFDTLSPDADDATRQRVAERFGATIAQALASYPWLNDPAQHLIKSPAVTEDTFVESVAALYNPAQLDVLIRANVIAKELRADADEGETPRTP